MDATTVQSPFLPGTQIQYAEVTKLALYSRASTTANFWRDVKVLESGCWEPKLASNAKGYIPVTRGGRKGPKERLHRVIYELCFGKPQHDILHTCDNRRCINPNHLYDGTAADNTRDMIARGRAKFVQPRTDHRHRVSIILLSNQGLNRFQIAHKLRISPSTVWNYLSPKGPYYVG